MKIVKIIKTELRAGLATDGVTIPVRTFLDSNENPVVLGDFGTFFVVVIKQGNKTEIIRCSGITQNADGTADLTVDTNGRDIPPKSPFNGAATGKAFQTGAELIVTNDPYTMSFFLQADTDNTFSGVNTYTQFPVKSGSTTPTDPSHFVTLAYLNSVLTGGGVVSSIASTVTFGEDVLAGQPVYFKTSDLKWWRAYANDPLTCINVKLGIVQEDALADETGAVVRFGIDGNQTGMTAGEDQYLTDAGGIDEAAGSYIVKMGTAASATSLIFEPADGDREQFLSAVTGMIVPYAGDAAPSGFLVCDGALYNYTDYPDLLNVIGVKYGLDGGEAFTVNDATNTIEIVAHGFANGKQMYFTSTGTLPGGLSTNTRYYVINTSTNNFQVALTPGGAAVDITSAGTGSHLLHSQFKVPDLRGSTLIGKGQKTFEFSFVDADVNTTTDIITLDSNEVIRTGMTLEFTNAGGALPTVILPAQSFAIDNSGYITGAILAQFTANNQPFYCATQSSTNLVAGTTYYVRDWTPTSFRLAASPGGAVVGSGNSGTGTAYATTINPGVTFYAIRVNDTQFQFSYTDGGAAIDLVTAAGGGTHTYGVQLTNRVLAEQGGEERHQLTITEMPSHNHTNNIDNTSSGTESLTGSPDTGVYQGGNYATGNTGGDQPHNNMPPFLVVNYIIKT